MPSTSSGGTNESVGRAQGRPDPQAAARLGGDRRLGAAALPGRRRRAGARRRQRQAQGRRRDEHHPLPHRPGAGDPALPAELAAPEPAGDAAAAPARAQLRTRLHQRLHVLAGALDPDERLLPRPARGQVHARGRHAGQRIPAGRTAGRTEEPRHGDEGGRLQRRLQGQVALLEAGRDGRRGARRPRKVRLPALEPAGRRRQPERARGGRRLHRQRRPLHRPGRQRRRRHRGRAAVPRARPRPSSSRSSW